MRVVKTDWRNRLNEENLTHLLRIKVEGPEFDYFHENLLKKQLAYGIIIVNVGYINLIGSHINKEYIQKVII